MNTSTVQLNTLYTSTLSLKGRHLPRMALQMARTRVKFSLPYISPKTWALVAGRGGGDAGCKAG